MNTDFEIQDQQAWLDFQLNQIASLQSLYKDLLNFYQIQFENLSQQRDGSQTDSLSKNNVQIHEIFNKMEQIQNDCQDNLEYQDTFQTLRNLLNIDYDNNSCNLNEWRIGLSKLNNLLLNMKLDLQNIEFKNNQLEEQQQYQQAQSLKFSQLQNELFNSQNQEQSTRNETFKDYQANINQQQSFKQVVQNRKKHISVDLQKSDLLESMKLDEYKQQFLMSQLKFQNKRKKNQLSINVDAVSQNRSQPETYIFKNDVLGPHSSKQNSTNLKASQMLQQLNTYNIMNQFKSFQNLQNYITYSSKKQIQQDEQLSKYSQNFYVNKIPNSFLSGNYNENYSKNYENNGDYINNFQFIENDQIGSTQEQQGQYQTEPFVQVSKYLVQQFDENQEYDKDNHQNYQQPVNPHQQIEQNENLIQNQVNDFNNFDSNQLNYDNLQINQNQYQNGQNIELNTEQQKLLTEFKQSLQSSDLNSEPEQFFSNEKLWEPEIFQDNIFSSATMFAQQIIDRKNSIYDALKQKDRYSILYFQQPDSQSQQDSTKRKSSVEITQNQTRNSSSRQNYINNNINNGNNANNGNNQINLSSSINKINQTQSQNVLFKKKQNQQDDCDNGLRNYTVSPQAKSEHIVYDNPKQIQGLLSKIGYQNNAINSNKKENNNRQIQFQNFLNTPNSQAQNQLFKDKNDNFNAQNTSQNKYSYSSRDKPNSLDNLLISKQRLINESFKKDSKQNNNKQQNQPQNLKDLEIKKRLYDTKISSSTNIYRNIFNLTKSQNENHNPQKSNELDFSKKIFSLSDKLNLQRQNFNDSFLQKVTSPNRGLNYNNKISSQLNSLRLNF